MARNRKLVPSYLEHSQSGRARAVWTDAQGTRQFRMLPGLHGSPESLTAFAKLQLECEVSPIPTAAPPQQITVNEMMLAYLDHAEQHYRGADGTPTDEVRHIKTVCRYVREPYGPTPAVEFGPKALKAVRQKFIGAGWCRKTINARVERVRRIFKWAVAEELVPPAVHQALAAVAGLQSGRTPAPETEPVEPVDDATVDATLPFLNRHVRGMVEVQRLTGSRPSETCRIRRSEIDMSGDVWLFKPSAHKTAWKGKRRVIAIGPKAQALLREFFTPDSSDYLFSPARAVEEFRAERSANRKTPLYPSHVKRNAKKRKGADRKRAPRARYTPGSYAYAVRRATKRAGVEGWHPHQLRHTHATRVRKEFGLEHAGAALGHTNERHADLRRAGYDAGCCRCHQTGLSANWFQIANVKCIYSIHT